MLHLQEKSNYTFLYQPKQLVKEDITINVPKGGELTEPSIRQEIQELIYQYGFFILRTHDDDALVDHQRFRAWREQLHLLLGNQVRQPYSNASKRKSDGNAVARNVLSEYGVDFKENDILMMSNTHDLVKGNKYDSDQKIHQDSTFLKTVPNWVVFTTLQNAHSGGETRLASGQHLLNAIPLPYLVTLKEADAVTFFREGTDGHLKKSIVDYDPEYSCVTTGYRADSDVDYICKNALTKLAMDWIWDFNQNPCNYTSVLLDELRESLVLANLVAFHGREGFTNSETKFRKVLRWTFDNCTAYPLTQGTDIPKGSKIEKAVTSQNVSDYLQQIKMSDIQRTALTQLMHLSPDDYPSSLVEHIDVS